MAQAEIQDVVRARRFEVVDAEGRVRVRIGPRKERYSDEWYPTIQLEIFDAEGKVRAKLEVRDDATRSDFSLTEVTGASVSMGAREWDEAGQAEVVVEGGFSLFPSSATMRAESGRRPGTWTKDPSLLMYGEPVKVGDSTTLRYVCDDAERQIRKLREEMAAHLIAGDRPEARECQRNVDGYLRSIERTRETYEAYKKEADRRSLARSKRWIATREARRQVRAEKKIAVTA
jgi:hypothetical protein